MRCYLFFLTYALDSEAQWRQSASHTHTYMSAKRMLYSEYSAYTFPLYLEAHDNTLYGLSCLSISASILSLVAKGSNFFLSQSPPPVPLNHCLLVNYPVMHLFHWVRRPVQRWPSHTGPWANFTTPVSRNILHPMSFIWIKFSHVLSSCPCENDGLSAMKRNKNSPGLKRGGKRGNGERLEGEQGLLGAYSSCFPPTPPISQLGFFSSSLFHTSVLTHSYSPIH